MRFNMFIEYVLSSVSTHAERMNHIMYNLPIVHEIIDALIIQQLFQTWWQLAPRVPYTGASALAPEHIISLIRSESA